MTHFDLTEKEEKEVKVLKEYNHYLNKDGIARLTYLITKENGLNELRKKNGM